MSSISVPPRTYPAEGPSAPARRVTIMTKDWNPATARGPFVATMTDPELDCLERAMRALVPALLITWTSESAWTSAPTHDAPAVLLELFNVYQGRDVHF